MTHVLVVNDDRGIRQLLQDVLTLEGYYVSAVEDGVQALDLLSTTHRHHVVVLDWLMPHMTGLDLIHALLKTPRVWRHHTYVYTGWELLLSHEPAHATLGLPARTLIPRVPYPFQIEHLLFAVSWSARKLKRMWPASCPLSARRERWAAALQARQYRNSMRGWYAPCRRSAISRRLRAR